MWRYRNQNELYHHGVQGMKWKEHQVDSTNQSGGDSGDDNKDKNSIGTAASLKKSSGSDDSKDKKSSKESKDSKDSKTSSKNNKIAQQVISGKFGNGKKRMTELKKAGYDYDKIQNIVNQRLLGKTEAKRIAKRRKK